MHQLHQEIHSKIKSEIMKSSQNIEIPFNFYYRVSAHSLNSNIETTNKHSYTKFLITFF